MTTYMPCLKLDFLSCGCIFMQRMEASFVSRPNLKCTYPKTLYWNKWTGKDSTGSAVVGGKLNSGEIIYIGRGSIYPNSPHLRVYFDNKTIGYIRPSTNTLHVSYSCGVRHLRDFEILKCDSQDNIAWIPSENGKEISYAFLGAVQDGEAMYIGKTNSLFDAKIWTNYHFEDFEVDQNQTLVGKVHSAHKCMYTPIDNHEVRLTMYDTLVIWPSPLKLVELCALLIRSNKKVYDYIISTFSDAVTKKIRFSDHLKLNEELRPGDKLVSPGGTVSLELSEKYELNWYINAKRRAFLYNVALVSYVRLLDDGLHIGILNPDLTTIKERIYHPSDLSSSIINVRVKDAMNKLVFLLYDKNSGETKEDFIIS